MKPDNKRTSRILAIDREDAETELEVELEYQLSLSASERYERMNRLVKDGFALIVEYGRQNDTSVVIRS